MGNPSNNWIPEGTPGDKRPGSYASNPGSKFLGVDAAAVAAGLVPGVTDAGNIEEAGGIAERTPTLHPRGFGESPITNSIFYQDSFNSST